LSVDPYLDLKADRPLGQLRHQGGLASQASYTQTQRLRLPADALGTFYVFVVTDPIVSAAHPRGEVYEAAGEANNVPAAPPSLSAAAQLPSDLRVEAIHAGGAQALVGGSIQIDWTVRNVGDQPSKGRWSDAVYLSTDALWDTGDRLIDRIDHAGDVASN